jgi:hypothetical protein
VHTKLYSEILKESVNLYDLSIHDKILLKRVSNKYVVHWIYLAQYRD